MKTSCTTCGEQFSQLEDWIEYHPEVNPVCVSCALKLTTADFEEDQAWGGNDLAHAYDISRQSTPEDDREDEHQQYPEVSDDEMADSWECRRCGWYPCRCREDTEIDDNEWQYPDAAEEEFQRKEEELRLLEIEEMKWEAKCEALVLEQAERDAQYATGEREYTASEFFAYDQEWNAAFSYFWFRLVGSKNYNRLVSPILVGIMRFKKRWRR